MDNPGRAGDGPDYIHPFSSLHLLYNTGWQPTAFGMVFGRQHTNKRKNRSVNVTSAMVDIQKRVMNHY